MKKLLDNSKNVKALYELFVFLCLLVMIASWFLNAGWIRILLALLFMIHFIIFVITMNFSLKYVNKTNKIGLLIILNCVTTLLCSLFMPDGGDTPESQRVFLGLIRNHSIISNCWLLLPFLFLMELIVFIWRMAYTLKVRDDIKKDIKSI